MQKGTRRKENQKIIKVKEPQICDNCKKAAKYICIHEDKIICKNCYLKMQIKNKQNNKINHYSNPKLCIVNKTGIYCNVCNQVVTTFQKFNSGKCICLSCYNLMTENQIKQLQEEKYNANNMQKYKNTLKIRFVQGGNP